MLRLIPLCLAPMASVWLIAFSEPSAFAHLNISIDGNGVQVQNGTAPPLVVPPGQSFGGTLTPQGFSGVMAGPAGSRTVLHPMENPFRAPDKQSSVSIALSSRTMKPPTAAELREVMRMADVSAARKQLDRMLRDCGPSAELLQCQAVLMLRMQDDRSAAACVYDAMAIKSGKTDVLMLLPDAMVSTLDRQLRQSALEKPSMKSDFLLAWWDHLRGNNSEAMKSLRRAMTARPGDPLFKQLVDNWGRANAH